MYMAFELDRLLARLEHEGEQPQGKWDPRFRVAQTLAAALRRTRQFLPTRHVVQRIAERAAGAGIRLDARNFINDFFGARHFAQTRPGYNTRIALVNGLPIVYRPGGWRGDRIVLVNALDPRAPLPPRRPIAAPAREYEYEGQYDNPPRVDQAVEEVCAETRRLRASVKDRPSAFRARQWLNDITRDWLPRARGSLERHNLDILAGCLFGLDIAIKRVISNFPPKQVRKMRHVVRRRLNL